MKVWELNSSEIGFTSFYFPEQEKVEFCNQLLEQSIDDNQKKSFEEWESLILLKKEQQNDPDFFEYDDKDFWVVSEDAAAMMLLILPQDSFELFPLLNDEKDYYIMNFLKRTDCLDRESSVFNTFENGLISDYDYLHFNSNMIMNTPVFKVPELPYKIFVTYIFKYYYDLFNLKGLNFDDDNVIFIN